MRTAFGMCKLSGQSPLLRALRLPQKIGIKHCQKFSKKKEGKFLRCAL